MNNSKWYLFKVNTIQLRNPVEQLSDGRLLALLFDTGKHMSSASKDSGVDVHNQAMTCLVSDIPEPPKGLHSTGLVKKLALDTKKLGVDIHTAQALASLDDSYGITRL
ncbi:unnamed protein product [Absidia cylindrospora]